MKEPHKPNKIQFSTQLLYLVFSVLFIVYGAVSLSRGRLIMPGKYGDKFQVTGLPMWLEYGSLLFATIALLSVIVDHYDKRNNERNYKLFYKIATWMAAICFIAAAALWAIFWPAYGDKI